MTQDEIFEMRKQADLLLGWPSDEKNLKAFAKLIAEKAIKEALAQPEEEKMHPVHIGVDVTKEGTAVTAFYRKPNAVMEMFYSQFHPLAQPEQEPVGSLSVRYHRGCKSMTNTDFDYNGNLPEGDYELYTTPPQPEFAIGDIRALRHRIHELEGEVIGYKQILDAQPGQEPVDFDAIIADIEAISCRYQGDPSHDHCPYKIRSESADTVRRHASYYTIPPQREWVGLTDDDRNDLWWTTDIMKLTQAIEAKLRSKNT